MNKSLIIILITVLLDIIWMWLVIPLLPFIIESFWFSEFYVWLTFAIFSLWMFIWGFFFWKLSDKIWRNKTLEITIFLNIIWYLIFAISSNLYLFLAARLVGWLGASWFAVWQAYISDISDNKSRTKNMAMIWAMFWIWFMIWPVIGWLLSNFTNNLNFIWFISAFIAFLNLLLVIFFLPKIKAKNISSTDSKKFTIKNPLIILLLSVSFIVALGFSAMQSTFPLVMKDRFLLDASQIWYLFWFIGLIAIVYQAKLIRYVKIWLKEAHMIIFGLVFLIVWFLLFSVNNYYWATFFIIFMFPIWYGTLNPTIASIQWKIWWNHVWKLLWINASMMSLWNIIWPFLAGYLYMFWSWLPYIISSILFIIILVLVLFKIKNFE